jgi:hypothetical protein
MLLSTCKRFQIQLVLVCLHGNYAKHHRITAASFLRILGFLILKPTQKGLVFRLGENKNSVKWKRLYGREEGIDLKTELPGRRMQGKRRHYRTDDRYRLHWGDEKPCRTKEFGEKHQSILLALS